MRTLLLALWMVAVVAIGGAAGPAEAGATFTIVYQDATKAIIDVSIDTAGDTFFIAVPHGLGAPAPVDVTIVPLGQFGDGQPAVYGNALAVISVDESTVYLGGNGTHNPPGAPFVRVIIRR